MWKIQESINKTTFLGNMNNFTVQSCSILYGCFNRIPGPFMKLVFYCGQYKLLKTHECVFILQVI